MKFSVWILWSLIFLGLIVGSLNPRMVVAGSNEWTWMSGNNAVYQVGIYGTLGTPASGNIPGARQQSISWIDSSGDLWLFGGYGYDTTTTLGRLNDLWRYDVSTDEWTWINGSNARNQVGTYGTLDTPASGNVPGARYGSISWNDSSGDLWIFGGSGYDTTTTGSLNDLWRYDVSTGYWTWMSGSNAVNPVGTYGTLDTPASGNVPGARFASISWIDSSGDLWLFGGWGYDTTTTLGSLNDLWQYDVSTGYWTWINGSNARNQVGTYGIQGTPASGNVPGARYWSMSWIDSSGDLWLFGGYGYDTTTTLGSLNDLWRYDVSTGYWTWMSGSNARNMFARYETQGTPHALNVPGARFGSMSWIDSSGDLWLFGGNGYDTTTTGRLNDLWQYDVSTGYWTWMSGSNAVNQVGTYGTLGTPASGNIPGGRQQSISWIDSSGDLWIFGGSGYDTTTTGRLNDLWRYDTALVIGEFESVGMILLISSVLVLVLITKRQK